MHEVDDQANEDKSSGRTGEEAELTYFLRVLI